MRHFLKATRAWILAFPLLCSFTGAALNQAVLVANHDKFPVMLNDRKIEEFRHPQPNVLEALLGIKTKPEPEAIVDDGMVDDIHCIMTSETHLNFLADWIDLGSIYSPGDMFLLLGEYLLGMAPLVWLVLIVGDVSKKKAQA